MNLDDINKIGLKFHHVGVACYDIEATSFFYTTQGYTKTEVVFDPIQKVNICFCKNMTGGGGVCIELISAHDKDSPINKILQKNGVSPYHFCYETKNIEESILEFKKQGFMLVSKLVPAIALDGRKICFLFNRNVGLIELVETEKE